MIINRLFTIRDQAERLRLELSKLLDKEQSSYRGRLREEIDLIGKELDNSKIPENFRIAIVGTFKTGKSSFVNKLAEERLAGVETNPETAAITIFRYAETTKAEVSFISSDEWLKMEELYEENPRHPDAYRVAGLRTFNDEMEKRKDKEGKSISFDRIDPDALIKEWLKQEDHNYQINAKDWSTKEGKQGFRKEIRQFTSSRNPLHYFVKELAVYAPVKLLRDHVELIDTPGLNDTQLYRGQLTEDLLSEVDAILFLTRSGASFSQYDKEFIVRQLRKKRLRHLRLIVTQVDTTFDSACHDAREEDEEPPTFTKVREKEEARLRSEIRQTLNELLDDSNLKDEDGFYYMEQLDALKIHFTSARWFDDGKTEDSGIPAVKEALIEVLSENYHLQQLVEHLERTIEAIKDRLKSFFNERLSVMETDFDPKKVEASMIHIEEKLVDFLDSFESTIKSLNEAHDKEQEALQELMTANIARMQSMSREVLSEFEKSDIARHWKSRRYGSWGYLKPLGEKVADKVFPLMESSLQRKVRPFNDFLDLASGSLDGLESGIEKLETESALEGLPKIEFSEAKERFMTSYVEDMKENVDKQKDGIIEFLENFATDELQNKLSNAKSSVSDIWGKGTTLTQNLKVEDFYDDIENSLTAALSLFLREKMNGFTNLLSLNANSLYPKLRASVQSKLDIRKQLIQELLTLQTGEAKKRLEKYLEEGVALLNNESSRDIVNKNISEKELVEKEYQINDEDSGFSYESIFGTYITKAEKIDIKEPYLRLRYQLDNFNHFCSLVAQAGHIKTIELITAQLDGDDKDLSDSYLEDIKRRLDENFSIMFNWKRDISLHEREIRSDNGWIILSDRGLDIYKKPDSRNEFGYFDLGLRKCKQTKIRILKEI